MDERKHNPRRRDRSRGGGRGRRRPDDRPHKGRETNGNGRDGNIAPKDDDMRMGKCSKCGGPAPDKTDLCRHCPKPPETEQS